MAVLEAEGLNARLLLFLFLAPFRGRISSRGSESYVHHFGSSSFIGLLFRKTPDKKIPKRTRVHSSLELRPSALVADAVVQVSLPPVFHNVGVGGVDVFVRPGR